MHLGLDVGILRSLDVRAAAGGTVTAAGWLTGYEGYGNVVTVDIGSGYTLLYAHLSVAQVVPGQWLAAGDPIGQAGCTGSCTGTHLHFELRKNGVADRPGSVPRLDPDLPPIGVMACPVVGATLRPAHDTDAPFAERARRPARLSSPSHQRLRHARTAPRASRWSGPPAAPSPPVSASGAVATGTPESTSACCARCGCARCSRGRSRGRDTSPATRVTETSSFSIFPARTRRSTRISRAFASIRVSAFAEDSVLASPAAREAAPAPTSISRSNGAACRWTSPLPPLRRLSWPPMRSRYFVDGASVVAVALFLGWVLSLATTRVKNWFVMTDELYYERLAVSVAQTGSLLPRLHGELVSNVNQLYPVLISPLFRRRQRSGELRRRPPAERVPDHVRGDPRLPALAADRARAAGLALGRRAERRRPVGRTRVVPAHRGRRRIPPSAGRCWR